MTDLLIVCSPGGHFKEAQNLIFGLQHVKYKFVIHDLKIKSGFDFPIIDAPHMDRDWRLIIQIFFAFNCLIRERPKVILSTGASLAVSFFLVGRLLGIKTIYVESPTRVHTPSLTARIVRFLSNRLYVRYESLQSKLPGSIFIKDL